MLLRPGLADDLAREDALRRCLRDCDVLLHIFTHILPVYTSGIFQYIMVYKVIRTKLETCQQVSTGQHHGKSFHALKSLKSFEVEVWRLIARLAYYQVVAASDFDFRCKSQKRHVYNVYYIHVTHLKIRRAYSLCYFLFASFVRGIATDTS